MYHITNKANSMPLENREGEFSFHVNFKGIVHPKMKIISDMLMNVGKQTVVGPL